jgi:DNA-directed RNA polymerase specialized sigma24 family protein
VGNYYRKAQRCTWQQEWEVHAREDLRQSALAHTPEKKIVHEELQGIVERILAQLPGTLRRAMELLIAGLDAGEIARQLHPERYQNVINHLYRGRRKFALELAKYGYGPNAKPGIIKRFRKLSP